MSDREYPFRISEYYSPGLNSLKRVYTQHPDFNGNVRLIYEILFDYWNPNYGYAFPTIWQLAADSGLGEATVERCIKTLIRLELIEKKRSPIANNNVYIVKEPLKSVEELIDRFPEVEVYRDERIARIKAREESSKARLKRKGSDATNVKADELSNTDTIAPVETPRQNRNDFDTSWL